MFISHVPKYELFADFSDEGRLVDDLFFQSSYQPRVRPISDSSKAVIINLMYAFLQMDNLVRTIYVILCGIYTFLSDHGDIEVL